MKCLPSVGSGEIHSSIGGSSKCNQIKSSAFPLCRSCAPRSNYVKIKKCHRRVRGSAACTGISSKAFRTRSHPFAGRADRLRRVSRRRIVGRAGPPGRTGSGREKSLDCIFASPFCAETESRKNCRAFLMKFTIYSSDNGERQRRRPSAARRIHMSRKARARFHCLLFIQIVPRIKCNKCH